MKIRSNRIYPYPIYSSVFSDYSGDFMQSDAEIEYDATTATISGTAIIPNADIKALFERHAVSLKLHIECPGTKFRCIKDIVPDADGRFSAEVSLACLNESIEIIVLIVAMEDIPDFRSETFAGLHAGMGIFFPKYAIIGCSDTFEFSIIKRTDVNGNIPSIITVTEKLDGSMMTYEADRSGITLFLPAEEYRIYQDYKGVGTRLKQMMMIVPALAGIFNDIRNSGEDYEGYGWYAVLEKALIKVGFGKGFEDDRFRNDNTLEIAQKVLGNISHDAFEEFDKMNREKD